MHVCVHEHVRVLAQVWVRGWAYLLTCQQLGTGKHGQGLVKTRFIYLLTKNVPKNAFLFLLFLELDVCVCFPRPTVTESEAPTNKKHKACPASVELRLGGAVKNPSIYLNDKSRTVSEHF